MRPLDPTGSRVAVELPLSHYGVPRPCPGTRAPATLERRRSNATDTPRVSRSKKAPAACKESKRRDLLDRMCPTSPHLAPPHCGVPPPSSLLQRMGVPDGEAKRSHSPLKKPPGSAQSWSSSAASGRDYLWIRRAATRRQPSKPNTSFVFRRTSSVGRKVYSVLQSCQRMCAKAQTLGYPTSSWCSIERGV